MQGKIINYLDLEAPERHDECSRGQADPGGSPEAPNRSHLPCLFLEHLVGVSLSSSFFVSQAPEVRD